MSDPTRLRRVLLEDDDGTVTDPVALPSEGTDQAALKAALQPILEQLEAGDIDAAEALDSVLEAVADPSAVNASRVESEYQAKQREQRGRERSARALLESAAGGKIVIEHRDVLVVARNRTEDGRRAAARELVEATLAKRKAAKRTKPIDGGEALAELMNG